MCPSVCRSGGGILWILIKMMMIVVVVLWVTMMVEFGAMMDLFGIGIGISEYAASAYFSG